MTGLLTKHVGSTYLVLVTVFCVILSLYAGRAWLLPLLLMCGLYPYFLSQWIRQRRNKLLGSVLLFMVLLILLVCLTTVFFPGRAQGSYFHHPLLQADRDYQMLRQMRPMDRVFREAITLLAVSVGLAVLSLLSIGLLYVPIMALIISSYSYHLAGYLSAPQSHGLEAVIVVLILTVLKIFVPALWGMVCSEPMISKVFSYEPRKTDMRLLTACAIVFSVLDILIATILPG
jgi:hypothetical protein